MAVALFLSLLDPLMSARGQLTGHESPKRIDALGDPLPTGAVARLGTERLVHAGVQAIRFAPAGDMLATAGGPRVALWDVRSGRLLHQWLAPQAGLWPNHDGFGPIEFSADGRMLAAGRSKGLHIWDTKTGATLLTIAVPAAPNAIAFQPGGRLVATLSERDVRVYDLEKGAFLAQFVGSSVLWRLAFSADGKTIVAAARNRDDPKHQLINIHRWDPVTRAHLSATEIDVDSRFMGWLSADGETYLDAACRAGPPEQAFIVRRWSTTSGKELPPLERNVRYPSDMAFTPDGKVAAALGSKGDIAVWRMDTGQQIHWINCAGSFRPKLALSPDARILAVASEDRAIDVREVASGKSLHRFPGHRTRRIVAGFSADARTLYTTNVDIRYAQNPQPGVEWSLRHWDVTTGEELKSWERQPRTETRQAMFSPDGTLLAVAENSGHLRLFHTRTCTELRAWQLPLLQGTVAGKPFAMFRPDGLAFSPDGKVIGISTKGKIHHWDWAAQKKLREIDLPGGLTGDFCFAPDARALLVLAWDSLTEVDATTGAELRQFAAKGGPGKVGVSPSGHSVVLLGHSLQAFESASGQERWSTHVGDWGPFACSPDSRALATAAKENDICCFDLLTGKLLCRIPGHTSRVESLAYSPDGRWLVSTAGNVALVWDVPAVLAANSAALAPLANAELQACWRDLGNPRAAHATPALVRLVRSGQFATLFLRGELVKLGPVLPNQVQRWVTELDHDNFQVREQAMRSLHDYGDKARPALEKALNAPPSLEAQRRIERLLKEIEGLPRNWLRMRRGVEVLELIGDPRACEALQELAKRGLDPELQHLAAQAVQRLRQRR
jgi:WD40 repeat protein